MTRVYFITYDLNARGGISYYSRAFLAELKSEYKSVSVVEVRHKNRWLRLIVLLLFSLSVPRGSIILSSHINFLGILVPFKSLKNLSLATIIYNKECEQHPILFILPKIDHFFPLFQSGFRRLLRRGVSGKNIALINNIINHSQQAYTDIMPVSPFLIISRLDKFDLKNKGIFYLLRAVRKCKNANIIIAGSGDGEQALIRYCKKFKIDDRVDFRGFVTEAEKMNLLLYSDVFIHLSDGEGIPSISVMEAIEHNCRILAHDDGSGDIERLPETISLILTNRYDSVLLAKTLSYLAKKKRLKTEKSFLEAKDSLGYYSARRAKNIITSRLELK